MRTLDRDYIFKGTIYTKNTKFADITDKDAAEAIRNKQSKLRGESTEQEEVAAPIEQANLVPTSEEEDESGQEFVDNLAREQKIKRFAAMGKDDLLALVAESEVTLSAKEKKMSRLDIATLFVDRQSGNTEEEDSDESDSSDLTEEDEEEDDQS